MKIAPTAWDALMLYICSLFSLFFSYIILYYRFSLGILIHPVLSPVYEDGAYSMQHIYVTSYIESVSLYLYICYYIFSSGMAKNMRSALVRVLARL